MVLIIAASIQLLILHAPNGNEISVNPDEIVSLRGKFEESGDKHFIKEVQCLINTADGKFITVVEHCDEIRRKIEEIQRQPEK